MSVWPECLCMYQIGTDPQEQMVARTKLWFSKEYPEP